MNNHDLRIATLTAGLALLVWLGILAAGTVFIWGGFEGARAEHRLLQMRIQGLQEKQSEVSAALTAYERRAQDITRIESALLPKEDILSLLLTFEEHAAQTGNAYTVQVSEEKDALLLHIELKGTFAGLYRFLDRIQTVSYLMYIDRMNTRSSDDGIQTSLRLRLFFL